ncbi:MAG: hypothetical protein LUC30_08425 [Clostridiales bacterium]|nr:hypothetical protein [Clostridiales bacterium]
MDAIISKLTSRKFWAAVVGVIVGVALAFGTDSDTITNVAGAVTSLVSIVTYIISEACIDAAAVNTEITEETTGDGEATGK